MVWRCKFCGLTLNSAAELLNHLKISHTPQGSPVPLPIPQVVVNSESVAARQEALALLRLEIEEARLRREKDALEVKPSHTDSFQQALELMGKLDGLISRKLDERASLEAKVREQIGDLAKDEGMGMEEQLGMKVLDLLASGAFKGGINKPINTNTPEQQAFIDKTNNPTLQGVGLKGEGGDSYAQKALPALPPNNQKEAATMAILPSALEIEEYRRAIKAGELTEPDAWAEFNELYPHLVPHLPREKFKEEYDKIKNS